MDNIRACDSTVVLNLDCKVVNNREFRGYILNTVPNNFSFSYISYFSVHESEISVEQFWSVAHAYLLQSAQAELAIIKTELEVHKSNPEPKGQKGNSLFAEVEDKRLDMKKRLDAILHKYRHLKKMYMDKCAEDSRISVSPQSCLLLLWMLYHVMKYQYICRTVSWYRYIGVLM